MNLLIRLRPRRARTEGHCPRRSDSPGLSFIEERNAGISQPFTDHVVESVLPPPHVVGNILRVLLASALVGDLVPFVCVEDINHIAFFRQLNAILVRIPVETPELRAHTLRLSQMKAVSATFLGNVLDREIRLSTERLDHLIEQHLGLLRVGMIYSKGLR